jgi:hypothetical protein
VLGTCIMGGFSTVYNSREQHSHPKSERVYAGSHGVSIKIAGSFWVGRHALTRALHPAQPALTVDTRLRYSVQ